MRLTGVLVTGAGRAIHGPGTSVAPSRQHYSGRTMASSQSRLIGFQIWRRWRQLAEEVIPFPETQQFADDQRQDAGVLASSLDLKRGLDVSERPLDTLPGDLQDELRKPRRFPVR